MRKDLDVEALIARYGSPMYIYDLDVVRARCQQLAAAITHPRRQLLYAMKANPCPEVVRTILAEGYGIDAVSPGEVALALRLGLPPALIQYTENNMSEAEMFQAMQLGITVTCGSLHRLERLARGGGREAAVRINPDVGASEHAHTLTAGPLTKFGIHHSQVGEILRIHKELGVKIVGCHMHIGSNILDADVFVQAMRVLLTAAKQLPDLRFIDFGGGLGIPYKPEQQAIDLTRLGTEASRLMADFEQEYGRELELRLEPGRFLVAEAGTLYTTVTSLKTNPAAGEAAARTFVGCDTGFNHLIRPCMYGSYHPILNWTRPVGQTSTVDIVGNICESGDVFARDRQLTMPQISDVLAIGCAGAYGMAMASTYNLRPLPPELVVDAAGIRVVRRRRSIQELLNEWEWADAGATKQESDDD